MQKFIIGSGTKLLNFVSWIVVIVLVLAFIVLIGQGQIGAAIVGCGAALVLYIIFVYALYLLVGIYEELKGIRANLNSANKKEGE